MGNFLINNFKFEIIKKNLTGVVVCFTIAAAGRFLSDYYGGAQIFFALLIGMAFHFLSEDVKCLPGIQFTSKKLLRVGVAFLGIGITLGDIVSLGWGVVMIVVLGVLCTLLFGLIWARLFKQCPYFGLLTGGAVAICGASAALAISTVLPKNNLSERNTIFTVIAVTVLSTLAMVLYPIITNMLQMSPSQAGIFIGGTIHDVAQVMGASYSISEESGQTATIIKLLRVSLLVPVVIGFSFYFRTNQGVSAQSLPFPFFLIGFVVLVGLNTTGMVPQSVQESLLQAARWLLVAAIAGIGIKTSFKSFISIGYQPFFMVFMETLFIAVFVFVGLHLIQGG